MRVFLWNILLALAWVALTGEFTPLNLVAGFLLGYVMLALSQRPTFARRYVLKVSQFFGFLLFFFWELIEANLRVAYEVITPSLQVRPGVVAIPLDVETDGEIMVLANLITLTPGTLSLDVSPDRKTLYIHSMYIDEDVEEFRRKIKDGLERRVREVFR